MPIYNDLTELVGGTPLMRLNRYCERAGVPAFLAKLEFFNPTSSVKDRAALYIVDDAERSGRLLPGGVIIEPTSGNTGVGLAFIAAVRGYRLMLTMPESMSIERRQLLAALGAEVVLTDAADGMNGAIRMAEHLHRETPGSILAGQFENEANVRAHVETTAEEIIKDAGGWVDVFVACAGTGGTVSGVGRALKAYNSQIQIIAVEPAASPLLSEGWSCRHGIQGIGANFVPAVLDRSIIDEVMTVTDEDAFAASRLLAKTEGLLVGISSGAAASAASRVAARTENSGKTVVTLFADTGERYLSAGLYK